MKTPLSLAQGTDNRTYTFMTFPRHLNDRFSCQGFSQEEKKRSIKEVCPFGDKLPWCLHLKGNGFKWQLKGLIWVLSRQKGSQICLNNLQIYIASHGGKIILLKTGKKKKMAKMNLPRNYCRLKASYWLYDYDISY